MPIAGKTILIISRLVSKSIIRYLAVMIEAKLSFQLRLLAEKKTAKIIYL